MSDGTSPTPILTELQLKERSNFYSIVGQGISFWTSMEAQLIEIASILLGSSKIKTGLVFYSIMSFHTWLTIIEELFSLDKKYAAIKIEWMVEASGLRELNDIRVRLAHHTIWDAPNLKEVALRPGRYDSRSKSKKHQPLTAPEVQAFTDKVWELEIRLIEIVKKLNDVPA